ncbi:DUF3581 family protein, partial [Vibrio parahaemolyticus]
MPHSFGYYVKIMFLTPYFSNTNHQFQFTREQASHFAKRVAGDYNP